jgi:hypothetical protein
MKQCSNCGRDNAEGASHCSQCGTALISSTKAPKRPFFPRDHLFVRSLIAICVGIVISAISLKAAWRQSANSLDWGSQQMTENALMQIQKVVAAYQRASNACPESFEQLQPMFNEFPDLKGFQSKNDFVDGWNHPLALLKEGTNCIVISYGRDGKPGGIGIDYDLKPAELLPKESMLTFQQFWNDERTRDAITWCFICGAMAGALSFLTVKIPNLTKRGLLALGFTLGATLLGSFIAASFITALHVPNGH